MAYTIISQNNSTTTLSDGVNTITVPSRVNLTSGNFTIVEVNNNMATLEDGDGNVYRDIPCVATLAGEGGGGGSGLPDQTGHSGEFLTTDGSSASWSDKPLVNESTGTNSIQIKASGSSPSNAIGIGNGVTVGARSVCIGTGGGSASGDSISIGNYAIATTYSVAIGGGLNNNSTQQATNYSIAIGTRSRALYKSIAIGQYTTPGNYGIVLKTDDATLTMGAGSIGIISGEQTNSNIGSLPSGCIVLDASTKTTATPYYNVTQDTFNVGLGTNQIYKVMDSDGTIPADRTSPITDISTATATQALASNYIYNCTVDMTSLEITLPATPTANFCAQVNFTSGSTPTAFTAPNTMKWLGDDVSSNVFVPAASKRYAIMVYYDGVNMRGISQAVA